MFIDPYQLKHALQNGITITGGGGIPEAPVDGQLYARENAAWAVVPPAGIADAPVDGNEYSRKNAAWTVASGGGVPVGRLISTSAPLTGGGDLSADRTLAITQAGVASAGFLSSADWNVFAAKLTDAPSDGTLYARLNAAWSAVPAPGISDAPSDGNYYGRLNATWAVLPLLGTVSYYWQNTASDVAGYLKQLGDPYSPKTTLSSAGLASGVTELHNFVTDPGIPGFTFIPAGPFSAHVHAAKTGGTKTAAIYAEIWECDAAGVDIGKIVTTETTPVLGGAELEYEIVGVTADTYALASAASRVVCRIFATVGGAGLGPTVAMYIGGTADAHLTLPSPNIDTTSFVPNSRQISTTSPLTGGGDLSVDRTLAIARPTPAMRAT